MGSSQEFVDYVVEQIENAGEITFRKMFGEYALYSDGKVVALICDDRLYVKPTDAGRTWIADPVEGQPYPGARPYFLIEEQLEDRDWISSLIRLSAEELPLPKKKKRKKKK